MHWTELRDNRLTITIPNAILALIALSVLWLQHAIATIISFAAIGIYISFQMIVLGAFIARAKGWRPAGPFTLGARDWLVNGLALAYGVSAATRRGNHRSGQRRRPPD